MPPIRDLLCLECGFEYEELLYVGEKAPNCPHCESDKIDVLPSAFGGYRMTGGNGASTTPKAAGSKPRRK
jgi:hypothetical protein